MVWCLCFYVLLIKCLFILTHSYLLFILVSFCFVSFLSLSPLSSLLSLPPPHREGVKQDDIISRLYSECLSDFPALLSEMKILVMNGVGKLYRVGTEERSLLLHGELFNASILKVLLEVISKYVGDYSKKYDLSVVQG